MFFLLVGIPLAIFVIRLLTKLMMGLSILNTILGWSDSLTEYCNTRIESVDVTDGHLNTVVFGIDVQSVAIDMNSLDIKRDNTKRMDYQGKEIRDSNDKPIGCIKNIEDILAQLKKRKGKEVIAKKGVGYLIDKNSQTIIFVDRRSIPTKAIELSLQRYDLQGDKKEKWQTLVNKIYDLGDKDRLSAEDINLVDEALTGFSVETYKERDAAVKENAKAFLENRSIPRAEKEKIKYLLAALKKMEDLQKKAEQKKADATTKFEKLRNGGYTPLENAQRIVNSFDETIDNYVDKAASFLNGEFSRKKDGAKDNDGFYQYVNYLVDVTEFECTEAVPQEIALQRTEVKYEKNHVRSNLEDKSLTNKDKEGWYMEGCLKDLQEYKKELEKNKKNIKEHREKLPVATEKFLEVEEGSEAVKSKQGVFTNLFSDAFKKKYKYTKEDFPENLPKNKEITKAAIHYKARKSLTQPNLYERIREFFGFKPTGLITAYNFLTGKKVKDLGDKAVDTQFELETSIRKQEEELTKKIEQAENKINIVKALRTEVVEKKERLKNESLNIYEKLLETKKHQEEIENTTVEYLRNLDELKKRMTEVNEIDRKIAENTIELSGFSANVDSSWAPLSKKQAKTLSDLQASYKRQKNDVEWQVSAGENAANEASLVLTENQLNLETIRSQLDRIDATNNTLVPLAIRKTVNDAVAAWEEKIKSVESGIKDIKKKMDTEEVYKKMKEAAVEAALALIRKEAVVVFEYRTKLEEQFLKNAQIQLAYDRNAQSFSYAYLNNEGAICRKDITITRELTPKLLKFLRNPTEEYTKLSKDDTFSKFCLAYEETLKNREKELEAQEKENRDSIEKALAENPFNSLREMRTVIDNLPSSSDLAEKIRAVIERPYNGNGGEKIEKLNYDLQKLEEQKEEINKINSNLNTEKEKLLDVNSREEIETNLKAIQSNQIAQLQQQLMLAAIQVGSSLNHLDKVLLGAQNESEHNQFFTQKDKANLRQALLNAKKCRAKVKIMASLNDFRGTQIYDQLNAELSKTEWRQLDDTMADSIVDRIESFINEGLNKAKAKRDELDYNLKNILREISVELNRQNRHEADATKLQELINKAVELSTEMKILNTKISDLTALTKKRKETAMQMLNEMKRLVNEAKCNFVSAKNSIGENNVRSVEDSVERAKNAAVSAEENYKLLAHEETKSVARTAVKSAKEAYKTAQTCIPREGFKHTNFIESSIVSKAEKSASTAEEESNKVIKQVLRESTKEVEKIEAAKKKVQANLQGIKDSHSLVNKVREGFINCGKEEEARVMARRLEGISTNLKECNNFLSTVSQHLEDSKISLQSLENEKINVSKLSKEIGISFKKAEECVNDSTKIKEEVEEIEKISLTSTQHLDVEIKGDFQERKLNYFPKLSCEKWTVVTPLISAEQQIEADIREKLTEAKDLSAKVLQEMKGSSKQLKKYAQSVEQAYRRGDLTTIEKQHKSGRTESKCNTNQYKLIRSAIAIENACYILVTKPECIRIVHKYSRGELSFYEANKAILKQENEIKNLECLIEEMDSLEVFLKTENIADYMGKDSAILYRENFGEILSDLKNLKEDILRCKNDLQNSSMEILNADEQVAESATLTTVPQNEISSKRRTTNSPFMFFQKRSGQDPQTTVSDFGTNRASLTWKSLTR